MEKLASLPQHVAIIMDGNGRWAQRQDLPRYAGHEAGVQNLHPVLEALDDFGIKFVTVYAFSTENWNRPKEEVEGLFQLLAERLEDEARALHKKQVRIVHLGRMAGIPDDLRNAINNSIELTKNNRRLVFGIAFNYGGRGEIIDGIKRLTSEGVPPEKITEEYFSRYLYTAKDGFPDVDLLIRTGGEKRISNFMMWQSAYSELYFTDVLWPDFNAGEVEKALLAYSQRQRRFGGLNGE